MTRPWRLTRRQRVEMEALRSRMWVSDSASDVLRACALLGWVSRAGDRWPASGRDWRLLRARVAIALRAALRADEDARCEEALGRVHRVYDEADYERSEMRGAAEDWCDELREWPPITYRRAGPEVPLVTVHPELADHPWAHGLTSRAYYVRLAMWEVVR